MDEGTCAFKSFATPSPAGWRLKKKLRNRGTDRGEYCSAAGAYLEPLNALRTGAEPHRSSRNA
jgi:hypothetical protein